MSLRRLIQLSPAALVAVTPALNARSVDEFGLVAQAADRFAASGESLMGGHKRFPADQRDLPFTGDAAQ